MPSLIFDQLFLCYHCNGVSPQRHDRRGGLLFNHRVRGGRIGHGSWMDDSMNRSNWTIVRWHKSSSDCLAREDHPLELDMVTLNCSGYHRHSMCGVVFPRRVRRSIRGFGSGEWVSPSRRYGKKWSPIMLTFERSINHVHCGIKPLTDDLLPKFVRAFAPWTLAASQGRADSVHSVADSDIENRGHLMNNAVQRSPSAANLSVDGMLPADDFDPNGIWDRPASMRRGDTQNQLESSVQHDTQSLGSSGTEVVSIDSHPSDNDVVHDDTLFPITPVVRHNSAMSHSNSWTSSARNSLSQGMRSHQTDEQRQVGYSQTIKKDVQRKIWAFLVINQLHLCEFYEWRSEAQDLFKELTSHYGYHWQLVKHKMQAYRNPPDLDLQDLDVPIVPALRNDVQHAVLHWLDGAGPEHYSQALEDFDFEIAREHFCKK